jgi:hypothetical protein
MNAGSPKGCESYGDGGPILVVGVTTGHEVRESRNEGEGGQVIGHPETWEVCEMQIAETAPVVLRELFTG